MAQVMGGIALILIIISYFFVDKRNFFVFNIIANIFYAFSFIFCSVLVAGINTLISIVRIIILYYYEKKQKPSPVYLIFIFIICYLTVGIIFFKDYYDVIVIITPILFAISMSMKNMQAIRYMSLLPNALLILYAIVNQVYTSALLNLLEFIAIIITILKFYKKEKFTNNDSN